MRKILEWVGIGVLGASTIITLCWRFIQSALNTKIASKVPSESFAFCGSKSAAVVEFSRTRRERAS